MKFSQLLILTLLFASCRTAKNTDNPKNWEKIKFDLSKFDKNGLQGPQDGKVSAHYEFCVPAEEKIYQKLLKKDPTLQKMEQSKGRSNCSKNEWLLIGNTQQANFRKVLYDLAAFDFVREINMVYFE